MKKGYYRSDNHYLRIEGEEKTVTEWSQASQAWGVSRQLIHDRLKRWLKELKKRKKDLTDDEYKAEVDRITEEAVFSSARRYRRREIEKPLENQQSICNSPVTNAPPVGG